MKKVLCVVLSVALLLCIASSVQAAETQVFPETATTTIKWVSDETKFEELFSIAQLTSCSTHELGRNNQNSTYSTDKTVFVYTFDVDGEGLVAPITVTGVLKPYEYEDLTVEMGTLRGRATINGISCSVYAVVQRAGSQNMMNAGVTIVPENTASVADYLYFFIGDPIITSEMLPEWIFEENKNVERQGIPLSTTQSRSLSGYGLIGRYPSNGTIGSANQLIEFYYNPSFNRSCVGVYSNVATIESNLSIYGQASTIVSSLKIGMTADMNNAPYIDCVHNVPEDAVSGEDLFNTTFIDAIIDIASEVFEVSATYTAPLKVLLDALSDQDRVSIVVSNTGTDSSILFEYTTNPFFAVDVNFDNAPMPITFQLDSATSSYGYFSAYAEIEYYTVIIPHDLNAYPMYYTSPVSTASTYDYALYVTS